MGDDIISIISTGIQDPNENHILTQSLNLWSGLLQHTMTPKIMELYPALLNIVKRQIGSIEDRQVPLYCSRIVSAYILHSGEEFIKNNSDSLFDCLNTVYYFRSLNLRLLMNPIL